MKVVPI